MTESNVCACLHSLFLDLNAMTAAIRFLERNGSLVRLSWLTLIGLLVLPMISCWCMLKTGCRC